MLAFSSHFQSDVAFYSICRQKKVDELEKLPISSPFFFFLLIQSFIVKCYTTIQFASIGFKIHCISMSFCIISFMNFSKVHSKLNCIESNIDDKKKTQIIHLQSVSALQTIIENKYCVRYNMEREPIQRCRSIVIFLTA